MILDEIAAYARKRVENDKKRIGFEKTKAQAKNLPKGAFIFEQTIKKNKRSLICEVKKASPSKGIISEDFPFLSIAKEYESCGASCISVLTEPNWFLGSDEIFCSIRKSVSLPMLRKDFTVDAYQLYQSKVMGADAVLLICALLDSETLQHYLMICNELGLSALVETHNKDEIDQALRAGARIIGVNNRNLKDFSVDITNAAKLRSYIPEDVIFVAESGVQSPEDAISLIASGANAVLIGEAIMRSADKKAFIDEIMEYQKNDKN